MIFERRRVIALALIAEGGVLLLAAFLSGLLRLDLVFVSKRLWYDCVVAFGLTLPPLLLFILSMSKKALSLSFLRELRQFVVNNIKGMFSQTTFVDIFFICVLAGISEEALFRGVIQAKLGIIWASVIFGLLHFITPAYFIFATAMGFYLGWVFVLTNGLFVPILIHFLYDFGALVYLKYYVKDDG